MRGLDNPGEGQTPDLLSFSPRGLGFSYVERRLSFLHSTMEVQMSKRFHVTTSDEYVYLKDKVLKLLYKHDEKARLKVQRARKQARKFIRRMQEIVKYHENMGWPHPEAKFKPNPNLKEALEALKQSPGKPILTNPDGSLYEKDAIIQPGQGFTISTKGVMNPDGTPFETPVMEGAVLHGGAHSEEKNSRILTEKRRRVP